MMIRTLLPFTASAIITIISAILPSLQMNAFADDPTPPPSPLHTLSENPLRTDQVFQVTPDGQKVVFLDRKGGLFVCKLDGTEKKNLSIFGPGANDRILVFANQRTEFAIVPARDGTWVYFQGHDTPLSHDVYLYRAQLGQEAPATRLFQIPRPYSQMITSPKGDKIYLAGAKHFILDTQSLVKTEVPVHPVYANQFKITPNFKWVIYTAKGNQAPGQSPKYEIRGLNLEEIDQSRPEAIPSENTLVEGLDQYEAKTDVSPDSSWLAVQKTRDSIETLVLVSLEGNELRTVYPPTPDKVSRQFDYLGFVGGIRGQGDAGRLLFAFRTSGGSRELHSADLNDFSTTKVNTQEVSGEDLGDFRITPDSKALVFQRTLLRADQPNRGSNAPKTFSLDLTNPSAEPSFIFQTNYLNATILPDSSAMLFVSSGDFFAQNDLILVTMDGRKSMRVSSNFPSGWIQSGEFVGQMMVSGSMALFTLSMIPSPSHKLFSFTLNPETLLHWSVR